MKMAAHRRRKPLDLPQDAVTCFHDDGISMSILPDLRKGERSCWRHHDSCQTRGRMAMNRSKRERERKPKKQHEAKTLKAVSGDEREEIREKKTGN